MHIFNLHGNISIQCASITYRFIVRDVLTRIWADDKKSKAQKRGKQ